MKNQNQNQIKSWMVQNASQYSCETSLVEGASCAFPDLALELDDECHWAWEYAVGLFSE